MKFPYTLLLTALLALSSESFGLGLQMYSLQEEFDRDTPATLDRLKAQGFMDLETSVFHSRPTGMTWQGKKKLGWRKDPYHSVGV